MMWTKKDYSEKHPHSKSLLPFGIIESWRRALDCTFTCFRMLDERMIAGHRKINHQGSSAGCLRCRCKKRRARYEGVFCCAVLCCCKSWSDDIGATSIKRRANRATYNFRCWKSSIRTLAKRFAASNLWNNECSCLILMIKDQKRVLQPMESDNPRGYSCSWA